VKQHIIGVVGTVLACIGVIVLLKPSKPPPPPPPPSAFVAKFDSPSHLETALGSGRFTEKMASVTSVSLRRINDREEALSGSRQLSTALSTQLIAAFSDYRNYGLEYETVKRTQFELRLCGSAGAYTILLANQGIEFQVKEVFGITPAAPLWFSCSPSVLDLITKVIYKSGNL
jgi:hypothetical protein